MTVIATLLAGLSSSEMTRAQYDRSLATQQQAKAGDQWSFFQAKRLRGVMQQGTLDALEFSGGISPKRGETLTRGMSQIAGSSISPVTVNALTDDQALAPAKPAKFSPAVQSALEAVIGQKSDAELNAVVIPVSNADLEGAIKAAKTAVTDFDEQIQPITRDLEHIHANVGAGNGGSEADVSLRDFAAARLRFNVRRYEAEARLNQTLANLFELEVRKSNLSADRHYVRSQRFFFGMLAAQLSVIMSTFATAVRMRNTLWTLAAVAGLFAVALAAYVYLWI